MGYITVFQTETGGYVTASYAQTILAVSGYTFVVGKGIQYRLDGFTVSGYLYIAKSGIANIPPGKYELLPQVVDSNNRVYFLTPQDIEIERVLGPPYTVFL